jgi:hypothetical protein
MMPRKYARDVDARRPLRKLNCVRPKPTLSEL